MTEKTFKQISILVLTLVVLITGFFSYHVTNIQLDYNFEEFFPSDDEETAFFFDHREKFESDNDFVLVAIQHSKGVFDEVFLQKVDDVVEQISELPYVNSVRSLTREKELFIYPGGITRERNYISLDSLRIPQDSITIYEKPELINALIDKNATALGLFIRHDDFLSKDKSEELVEALKSVFEKQDFERVRMAGRTVGQLFYIDLMMNQMMTYISLSFILIIVFLFIAFRSLWGILVPFFVVSGSMLWIVGFMGWMQEPINILLVILPSIMFVVAMSDVIHLVSKYLELLREGKPKYEAIIVSFKEIGLATLLTSVTTAIGFFSLLFVRVIPIQVFGKFIGIGVLFAFILTFSTLPFLFYYSKTPRLIREKKKNFWLPILRNSFLYTLRNRKIIPWVALIFIGFFAYGMTRIQVNNYILDDIRSSVSMKQDFDYFDDEFGGVRPFELVVTLKDSTHSIWDLAVIENLSKLETFLQKDYEVDVKLSLSRILSILNRAANLGDSARFRVPASKKELKPLRRALLAADKGNLANQLIDSTGFVTRISGTIPDWGNKETRKRTAQLEQFYKSEMDTTLFSIQPTGSAHLLDKNMYYMSSSLAQGLSFAIIVVAVLMGILFKSGWMVVISLIPNLIPLLLIAGIMGFFGIDLKITTAIVFTIAFGIAVDDTIHFLSKYKLELNKGKSPLYALKRTYLTTGKAIVLTSTILCSGFTLLLLSDFLGTFYMGLMVGITLFFAVIADLFLLPILLIWTMKPRENR